MFWADRGFTEVFRLETAADLAHEQSIRVKFWVKNQSSQLQKCITKWICVIQGRFVIDVSVKFHINHTCLSYI